MASSSTTPTAPLQCVAPSASNFTQAAPPSGPWSWPTTWAPSQALQASPRISLPRTTFQRSTARATESALSDGTMSKEATATRLPAEKLTRKCSIPQIHQSLTCMNSHKVFSSRSAKPNWKTALCYTTSHRSMGTPLMSPETHLNTLRISYQCRNTGSTLPRRVPSSLNTTRRSPTSTK